jgi:hypothetical protein
LITILAICTTEQREESAARRSYRKQKNNAAPTPHPNHQKRQDSPLFAPKQPKTPKIPTNLQKITRSGYKILSKKEGEVALSN